MIKKIKYFIEAIFIYTFFGIAKLIGLTLGRKLFSFLFNVFGPAIRSNKIILKNLEIFSNNISNIQKKEIVKSVWSNYGMTFVEYIFLKKFKNKNSHIEILGTEILEDVVKENKPVIFVSGHFSNFELMSMELTKKNIKLATIYRPLNNFFLNPLMEYLRKKYICKNQIKKGINGVKSAIEFIKNGHSIAMMIDQRVSEGEKIRFFNKEAYTTTLPAQLILKYNLKVIPIFIERDKKNKFIMKVFKPMIFSKDRDKLFITIELNKVLENMILKNPNQWIWTHNRWK
ncbi:lysophospholipid acyltransferase family protein [Candidatus Pelagibacter bacterium]|nr:lysophospholipid acyltransferase family protein [Candidatus Pelagibacter bacterium]